MKLKIVTCLIALSFYAVEVSAKQESKLDLICLLDGTGYSGKKSKEKIVEKFKYYTDVNDSGKFKGFGIVKSEFSSDGENYDITYSTVTSDYAVAISSIIIGKGLRRKLLVFTYVFDLESFKVDRVLTSLPAGLDERMQGECKINKQ
jgi:hypothetical protein